MKISRTVFLLSFLITIAVFLTLSNRSFAAYPPDLNENIDWPDFSETTVTAIENMFNAGRIGEMSQLGTTLPMLSMPSQAEWDSKSDTEKVLWLVNEERDARDVMRLHSGEPNVISVAQNYANLLLEIDEFSHVKDGDPWDRLEANPAIGDCYEFLGIAENLAAFSGGWTLPLERSVYMWMYADDADDDSAWGHRQAILWYPYNDNSGVVGREGFLGIGTAVGPYTFGNTIYEDSIVIVMNVFDPCASWDYSSSIGSGDVNADMMLNLADAILVLKLLTGSSSIIVHPNADMNENDVIGMEEVIFILGKLSQ